MTLTLEISTEVQRELAREAEVRGVDVPALGARLPADYLKRKLKQGKEPPYRITNAIAERTEDFTTGRYEGPEGPERR